MTAAVDPRSTSVSSRDRPAGRLAVFAPSMVGGGAERGALKLAEGLARRGFAVDLVLASAEGPRLAEVPRGVHVVDLRARLVLTALPALVRYLRRARPLAMASVLDHANVVALWARRIARSPRRVVVIEHNTLSQVAGNASSWRDRASRPASIRGPTRWSGSPRAWPRTWWT